MAELIAVLVVLGIFLGVVTIVGHGIWVMLKGANGLPDPATRAPFITGEILYVDGGAHAGKW